MKVYLTGRIPPVWHMKRNCIGILLRPRELEVEDLQDIPSSYEACLFCIPKASDKLDSGQKGRLNELKELLG